MRASPAFFTHVENYTYSLITNHLSIFTFELNKNEMKIITFNPSQQTILVHALSTMKTMYTQNCSFDDCQVIRERSLEKTIKPLLTALEKIKQSTSFSYSSMEKTFMRGAVKNYKDNLFPQLNLPTAVSWLTISEKQKKVVSTLDNCIEILAKCDYYTKNRNLDPDFRYSKILKTSENILKSKTIFIGRNFANTIYKIAFVNNNAYYTIKFHNGVDIAKSGFVSFQNETAASLCANKFDLSATKLEAKNIMAMSEKEAYTGEVKKFIDVILT